MNQIFTSFAAALAALAVVSGCSEPERVEITGSRPRHSTEKEPRLNVPYEQAFPEPGEYRWTLPSGWTEAERTQFRLANFSLGPNGEGECYLSRVQGGMIENINRWCAQMGYDPMTGEQVADLPVWTLFGQPGRLVDLSGTYTGASGAPPKPDYRLIGLVVSAENETVTVKMTGPAEVVAANTDEFEAFCQSLRFAPGYPR